MYRKILTLCSLLAFATSAQAALVLDLTDDGFGGVIATFTGSGTTTGFINSQFDANDIGDYMAASHGNGIVDYSLATPISFAVGSAVVNIELDRDGGSTGNDDFEFNVSGGSIGSGTMYNIAGSSLVTGLDFADLIVGSYSGSTSADVERLGGFTLNVVAASVPEPGTLGLLALSAVALGLRRRKA